MIFFLVTFGSILILTGVFLLTQTVTRDRVINETVERHKLTLARKFLRGQSTDEYGVQHSDFDRELDYFIANVLAAEFTKNGIHQYDPAVVRHKVAAEIRKRTSVEDMQEAMGGIGFRDDMAGEEYEKFVSGVLADLGWTVTGTAVTGDQGVDLLAERDGRRVAIQCKRYTGTVGNKAVQEAVSGATHYQCNEAWVITNSEFSKSARQLADSTGVLLLNHDQLADV